MRSGSAPASIRATTASTSVVVLPVPGPASTSSGPARCATTACWLASRVGGATGGAARRTSRYRAEPRPSGATTSSGSVAIPASTVASAAIGAAPNAASSGANGSSPSGGNCSSASGASASSGSTRAPGSNSPSPSGACAAAEASGTVAAPSLVTVE